MGLYIGIDLGTSAVKLLLLGEEGEILRTVSREYPLFYPHPGWSEQHPADWWQGVTQGMKALLQGFDGQAVKGIGVAGQMHGLVTLDREDRVIRPAILWNDGRTGKETDYLNQVIGKETLFAYTGNIAFAGFTAPKLLWMRENEPQLFAKIRKVMLPKDYINYMLTGVFATDYSDAAGTLLLDVKRKCWSKHMLEICSLSEARMPKLYESYQVIGRIKPQLAEQLGIDPTAVVVAGAGDNAAAAIGTATVGQGECNISLGTSGTVFVASDSFAGDPHRAIHSFCHADGGFHLMGCMLSAASCAKWFSEQVLQTNDFASLEQQISHDRLGKGEVLFLPYLMGERSPINDTNATGTLIGLRPDTTGADIYQAILEGVAFAIRDNIEVIGQLGVKVFAGRLCGGGAKSALWRKILAAVLAIKLMIPATEQGPGYGSAMLAMVGAGKFQTPKDAADAFVSVSETVTPDPQLVALYAKQYQKYKKLYPALKQVFQDIKE